MNTNSSILRLACAAAFSVAMVATGSAQQTVVTGDGDITIRGCVGRVAPGGAQAQQMLVWTRGDIMLSNATPVGTSPAASVAERVFFWLDNEDDLSKHMGQMVEVKGELGDFEKGELTIKRDGEFTEIELDLAGKKDKARVPTSWLGPRNEGEFDIASRKIDVEKVSVIGSCVR